MNSIIQKIDLTLPYEISLFIKREDLLHPFVSGNKYRKLKYNLIEFKESSYDSLVTFGGAFSNHIAATAYACKENNINSLGVIRGEELWKEIQTNPTLEFAQECGMKFEFVSREQYRNKYSEEFLNTLRAKYGNCFILPEGGTNEWAVKGCAEILNDEDSQFDFVCCAVGTGGTISGIINSSFEKQTILGFPALKGDFLIDEIRKFAKKSNWNLVTNYHFGGYAKVTDDLIDFINTFFSQTRIPLDPIYTGKMVYGVIDLIHKRSFPFGSKILLIHTGGLQGVEGMNNVLKSKNKKLIVLDE